MYVPVDGKVEPFTKFSSPWITRPSGVKETVMRQAESALDLCNGMFVCVCVSASH